MISWLRSRSSYVSVAGALVLFVALVFTQLFALKATGRVTEVEAARSRYTASKQLRSLRVRLDEFEGRMLLMLKPDASLADAERFKLKEFEAVKVATIPSVVNELAALSRSFGPSDDLKNRLENYAQMISEVDSAYAAKRGSAQDSLDKKQPLATVQEKVGAFAGHVDEVLSKRENLIDGIDKIESATLDELQRHVQSAKRWAAAASWVGVGLSILGTLLTLVGLCFEKIKPQEQQKSSDAASRTSGQSGG